MSRAAATTLAAVDELRAADVGFRRRRNAIEQGLTPRHSTGSRWGGDIEGACAELAVAQWLRLSWTGEPVWVTPPSERQPDVGERTEVRWVQPQATPCLYFDVRRDRRDWAYVLVAGYAPTFEIHGYIWGRDAEIAGELIRYPERDVRRVPCSALRPLDRPGGAGRL